MRQFSWSNDNVGQATPPAGSFSRVSGEGWHTCAIRTDGNLVCWGTNNFGQATPPSGTFVALSAGTEHNCAIRNDGTIACWGRSLVGESAPPADSFVETAVAQRVISGYSCGQSCLEFRPFNNAVRARSPA